VFVAFKSADVFGAKIGERGGTCLEQKTANSNVDFPSADCVAYAETKDNTIATCAAECVKLRNLWLADKATGANCVSFVQSRFREGRSGWSCELRSETPLDATRINHGASAALSRSVNSATHGEVIWDTYVLGSALLAHAGDTSTDLPLASIPIHPIAQSDATQIQGFYARRNGEDSLPTWVHAQGSDPADLGTALESIDLVDMGVCSILAFVDDGT
jgi:hypothetical protein